MIIDVPKRQHHIDQMNNPSANTWRIEASSTANDDYDYSTEKNTSKLILEAETLRAQAKAMMAQALAMEQELRESRSKARKSKVKEIDHLIEQWFQKYTEPNSTCTDGTHSKGKEQGDDTGSHVSILSNATTIANRLEEENATLEQVLVVVDRLFERQMEASGQTFFLKNGTADLGTSTQSYVNATEYERLSDILDLLIFAAVVMDKRVNDNTAPDISPNKRWSGRVESAIRARLNELRRTQKVNLDRKLKAEMNKAAKSATGSVEDYVRRNLVGQFLEQTSATNSSSTAVDGAQENVALVPLWVPSVFLPFMHDSHASSLGPEQVKALKDQVLMGSKFYVTSHNSVAGAALFRGNIRGTTGNKENKQHTAFVFEDIQRRLEKIPSLQDQVQLFLLPDPEWKPKDGQEPEPTPVLLALPKETSPDESKITTRLILKLGKSLTYPLAAFTTLQYAIKGFSLNELFFDSLVKQRNLKVLMTMCLPVVGGIFAMQVLQEVVHYLVAKWRGIKVGSPVPVPSVALGMFGCITPIKSFPASRAALLDFALSGPFATTIASIGCIIASMILTVRASPATIATFPVLPTLVLKSSLLAGTIISWIASKALMLPLAQPIPVHPLFLVGYAGLISSGLNLLPIFRLDGGRACTAAMGPRQGAVISVSILLFLLSLALSGGSGLGFYWGMFVAIFQRRQEIPARDDVTEVDNVRLGAWMFSFLLSISILTPFPGAPSTL